MDQWQQREIYYQTLIYHMEIQLHSLQHQLQTQHNELQTARTENQKLKEALRISKEDLKKQTIPKERKSYLELCKSGRRNRRDTIKRVLKNVCDGVSKDADITAQFVFKRLHCGKKVKLNIDVFGESNEEQPRQTAKEAKYLDSSRKILGVKDRYRLPYKALQALRREAGLKIIPPKGVLHSEAMRLASSLTIIPMTTIPSKDGSMRTMSEVVKCIMEFPKNKPLLTTEAREVSITLRFACDGAKITKYKNSVRGVCKLIQPPGTYYSNNDSPDDEFTLFVYMGEEKRDPFEAASQVIRQQMKDAAETGVEISGKIVKVNWLFCSDWKAMSMVKGINAANSKYFCMWCLCTKKDIADFTKTWSVERNAVQQTDCLGKAGDQRLGYSEPDLLSWIPYNNVIIDELHLRLRISSKLLNQVIVWALMQDKKDALVKEMTKIGVMFQFHEEKGDDGKGCIKKWTSLGGKELKKIIQKLDIVNILDKASRDLANLEKLPKGILLKMLQQKTGQNYNARTSTKDFLVQELHSVATTEEQRELRATCETRSSRILVEGASPQQATPCPEDNDMDPSEIRMLWDEFDVLMESLKAPKDAANFLTPERFHWEAKEWALKFRKETFKEDVIPYIHALVYHVPEAMKRHGHLPHVGISQVERKNYDQHLAYFQGTNKEGGRLGNKKPVTRQILERENRLVYFKKNTEDAAELPERDNNEDPFEEEEQGHERAESTEDSLLLPPDSSSSSSESDSD